MQLHPSVITSLERQSWFAHICSFLFGFHWSTKVTMMELSQWRQHMRELQLVGQVTDGLANSVLKTAYVKMLPRSVARIMLDLSQLITNFMASLHALECGAKAIDIERLKLVWRTYFQDVQMRVLTSFRKSLPSEADMREVAVSQSQQSPVVFDGADSAELNEKYFTTMAREAIASWQQAFDLAMEKCCREAAGAHQKWQRSIDHYLTQDGVDAATKQKVLRDSKNLTLITNTGAAPLGSAECDRLVVQHAEKVSMTTSKQLFQRTRQTYHIKPENVVVFVTDLFAAWSKAAEVEINRRCIQPVEQNYNDMVSNIEELNSHRLAASLRSQARESFDFAFAHRLEEVLPKVAAFKSQESYFDDVVEPSEADRCETLCAEVRAALADIEKWRRM